jgi:LysR family cyn operon transcriptional activator
LSSFEFLMDEFMLPRHLNYFIAVAEHGGFTRAAAILHVSQPALSQQIRQLEETLGVRLFDRSGRNTCLTDAGKVWLIYARRALRELAEGSARSMMLTICSAAPYVWR